MSRNRFIHLLQMLFNWIEVINVVSHLLSLAKLPKIVAIHLSRIQSTQDRKWFKCLVPKHSIPPQNQHLPKKRVFSRPACNLKCCWRSWRLVSGSEKQKTCCKNKKSETRWPKHKSPRKSKMVGKLGWRVYTTILIPNHNVYFIIVSFYLIPVPL